MDTAHLSALITRLSHERGYLAKAKSKNEREMRTVWIAGIEREIKAEEKFLGMAPLPEMTDEEILAEMFAS